MLLLCVISVPQSGANHGTISSGVSSPSPPPLRHSSDRVNQLESLVETYKRKLEDLGDLRRQVRLLEERNTVYMQRTCELEEELRKANVFRTQMDTYKKQASAGGGGERGGGARLFFPASTSKCY